MKRNATWYTFFPQPSYGIMEPLKLKALRKVLMRINDDADSRQYLRLMANTRAFARRRFGVAVEEPRDYYCNWQTVTRIYVMTLREILNVQEKSALGIPFKGGIPSKTHDPKYVHCYIRFERDELCDCYSCTKMR